ncbi:PAS domain S-box protein [Hydrogenophaga sp.]|uniref:PAS domain-containing sensor histidine kinase n=1 Tax=Hydrogenophaga sp. TaxID=1904254 RepID=UPI0025C712D5|nr:PAS domain S-box protein [Hydrogenophaga sp.]
MPEQHSPQPGEHRPGDPSGALDQHRVRALRTLLLAAGAAVPAIALAVFLRDGITTVTLLIVACCVLVWLLGFLFYRKRVVLAAHGLVLIVLASATITTLLTGGVRSAGVFVMLASIALAGTFLSRAKMVAVALYTIVALGVINWLEQRGMLPGMLPPTGWTVWVIQVTVVAIVLVSALAGQYRLQEAFERQEDALTLAHEAEIALRATKERFKSLFRNNPAASMVQSMETSLLEDANEAYIVMCGYSREELVGYPPPNLWADPIEEQVFRATLRSHGRVSGMRARGRRRDGSLFDSLVYAEIIQQGNKRLMIGIVLDMSAEEKSREALQQSEERFSKAFNFSPLGMTITRMSDGLFLEVNPANERVLGYSREDFMERTSVAAGVWLSEADRTAYIDALRLQGRLMGFETRMRSKQGDPVDVKIWSERIELENEPCNLAFTLNVTEEKRKADLLLSIAKGLSAHTGDAFFQSLVQQLAQAIGARGVVVAETRPDGGLRALALACNGQTDQGTAHDLNATVFTETLGSTGLWFTNLGPDDSPPLCPEPATHPLGSYAGVAMRDDDGSAIGLLGVFWLEHTEPAPDMKALITIFASRCNSELLRLHRDRDLHKLQATLEQRVADRTAELELLNRELDTFAYSVSHDLKSPLRSIDGFMHMLQEQAAPRCTPDDQILISRVMASAQRMHGLINDLLALARVSQTQLQRTEVNLSEIAEDVIRQERHRDPEHTVDVIIETRLIANCDARLAQIVLENLLGNAWKYSHKAQAPRIEFGRTPDQPGDVFFVRDNGAGFDMTRSDRLFKPFTRLHQPSEFQGSGIGLATVRRIIERHGGKISGAGAVGRGAEFQFRFGRSTGA